jgi:hypothetical protein
VSTPTRRHSCGYTTDALGHRGPCLGQWPAPPPPPQLDPELAEEVTAATDHTAKVYDLAVRSWARKRGLKVTPRLSGALKAEFDAAHPAPALVS